MDEREQLLDEVDSYGDSVRGLLALIHEIRWDDDKKASRTDIEDRHGMAHPYAQDKDPVTPDVSLVHRTLFALVGDVKASFGGSGDKGGIRDQLLRYDLAVAWIGDHEGIPECGTVLLTHGTKKNVASEYFESEYKAGRFAPGRPFAVVGFMRNNQRRAFMYLERAYGSIVPSVKDGKLHRGVPIRLEWLDEAYGGIKFCDGVPPLCYVLEVIWNHLLQQKIPEERYTRDDRGAVRRAGAKIMVEADAEALAAELRSAFSLKVLNPSVPGSPKVGTVREALNCLVRWDLAIREGDKYKIGWRKLRPGALEYFVRRTAAEMKERQEKVEAGRGGQRRRGPKSGSGQIEMFEKD